MRIALPPRPGVRLLCLAAFALVLAQIFFLAEPPLVRELRSFFWDKTLHAAAFGAISVLLWFGIGYDRPVANWLVISAVAALDEVHQIFIPTRTADVLDVVADMVGAAVVTFILHHLSHPRARARAAIPEAVAQPGD